MIHNTTYNYYFIRFWIILLNSIAPLSILYTLVLTIAPVPYLRFRPLLLWAYLETLFFCLVYLPSNLFFLQRSATHPAIVPYEERQILFKRCFESIPDIKVWLTKWFKDAKLSDIKKENLKQYLAWAFLSKNTWTAEDDQELDDYVSKVEKKLERPLDAGLGSAQPLRLTMDKAKMLHRSLIWYLCVGFVDSLTFFRMLLHSYSFYGPSIRETFTTFPFRLLGLLSFQKSPAKSITYWYRPHTSTTKSPILFIHGIGIGLYPYVHFLDELNRANIPQSDDDEVGIIVLELMPISFRITTQMPSQAELCAQIHSILRKHNWDRFVLVAHSYGTVVASHLLRNANLGSRITATLLVDPVVFLLHLPDVAYNFTHRLPERANEHQLHYFASMDMGVSHTLARHFFWSENILWKEDIQGRKVTVVLGGQDLIVNADAVGRYLTDTKDVDTEGLWKKRAWAKDGLNLIWLDDLDHAQVFEQKPTRTLLVDVLLSYCANA